MQDYIEKYRDLSPIYGRLNNNIMTVLEQLVREQDIPLFAVESRIKEESSFLDKIVRKDYSSPFDEIDDICGIRVICYYQEDIQNICSIVEREFKILKKENKRDEMEDDQFGYTSYHYVVSLKNEWLEHPSARGLKGLRAEIQIRTMLMHTWSAISHKLLYKRGTDVPPSI